MPPQVQEPEASLASQPDSQSQAQILWTAARYVDELMKSRQLSSSPQVAPPGHTLPVGVGRGGGQQ